MCDKTTAPVLTDYDITVNSIQQDNMFKGTIMVCIIYAVFAFILIIFAYIFDNIRELLFDKFLPFTLIYIIGTIVIIMIFLYYILSFKPKKVDRKKVEEGISCPDYWKLEVLPDDVVEKNFDVFNYNKNLFKYRCVMDDNVFNKSIIYKQDKKIPEANQYRIGNISPYYTKTDSTNYTGLYDKGRYDEYGLSTSEEIAENNKGSYLYKNINSYVNSNLSYDGKKNSNILNDLRESALIMNNYKAYNKNSIYSNIYNDNYNTSAGSKNNKHKIYYGAPPVLTWATPGVTTNAGLSTSSTNAPMIPNTADSATYNYSATVYDWNNIKRNVLNTFGTRVNQGVYIVDTSKGAINNYILVGKIVNEVKTDANQNITSESLYFESENNINYTTANPAFNTNKNLYFPDTYLFKNTFTITGKNITKTDLNITYGPDDNCIAGPKIRLFNNLERVIKFYNGKDELNNAADNTTKDKQDINTTNIPLTCSSVYPSLLSSKESNYEDNNTLRCAYAKVCNIPWSDMNCSDIQTS